MNELVLNYLLVEGYKAAADSFVADCGIDTQREEKSKHTKASQYICHFIVVFFQNCYTMMMLLLALRFVPPFTPATLCAASNSSTICNRTCLKLTNVLGYALQLQRLVELVRQGDGDGAVQLARGEVGGACGREC
jgi:hypothetical protein